MQSKYLNKNSFCVNIHKHLCLKQKATKTTGVTMPFCQFSSESVISNTTNVDNIFIENFLPTANADMVKVYLYGLYKCNNPNLYDNTLDSFSAVLGISQEDIYNIYLEWQDQGLVKILATEPFEVVYLPLNNVISNTKKYNKDKYADFNMQLESIIQGRNITLNEYYQYYEFMEVYHMEPAALILIIEYCVRAKGIKIGYNYILTIAKNWAHDGIISYDKVEQKLCEVEQNSSEIGELFATLGIKRVANLDEKELLTKWKNDLEFNFETILGVCKLYKKKKIKLSNLDKLDTILTKYYEMKLASIKEIENYEAEKEGLFKISRQICKELGLYYDNIEPVSSTYTQKWMLMGYSNSVLHSIANYCFKSSIRNLDGMDSIINKLFKLGVITADALEQYFDNILRADEQIKEILSELGIMRNVNKFDREFYKIWTEEWNTPLDIINYAMEQSKAQYNPMQHMNKLLSLWHTKGAKTLEDCKKYSIETKTSLPTNSQKPKHAVQNFKGRDYSKSDLNALFDNLEEINL